MSDTRESASSLTLADELADLDTPYLPIDSRLNGLFLSAMQEADDWHRRHNEAYAMLYDAHFQTTIPVALFKSTDLATPVEDAGQWLTSSGTGSGGKTKVFFDVHSLSRIQRAMTRLFIANNLVSQTPSRFLLLSPDPAKGDKAGYATAFLKFTACAPVSECVFAVSDDGCLDTELAWDTLKRWANDSAPIYVFGLTVFFEHLCLSRPEAFTLKAPVRGLTGGGWKGMTQRLSRKEIVAGLAETLTAPVIDIRDIYGMTEHPLHYVSCREGHFHQPVYARFTVINANGDGAQAGEAGLIRLENPFFAALPSHRLLTEDVGEWSEGCACGLPGRFLRYIGRSTSPEGTCAAQAL